MTLFHPTSKADLAPAPIQETWDPDGSPAWPSM